MSPARAAAEPALTLPHPSEAGSGRPREVSIALPGGELRAEKAPGVEIRLVERDGEVQVAVRSRDPGLAHALGERLGDLVSRLDQAGYRAEAWRPEVTAPADAGKQGFERQTGREPPSPFDRNGGFGGGDRRQPRDSDSKPKRVRAAAGAGVKAAPARIG
jgi:hypothetical protein